MATNFIRSSAMSSSRRDPTAGTPGTSMSASPVPEMYGMISSSSSKCINCFDDNKAEASSLSGCAQPQHHPDRCHQQQWGRIKSRRWTRKRDRLDGVAENRCEGVAEAVEHHHCRKNPRQQSQPADAPKCEWRKAGQDHAAGNESSEPLAVLKRRHGKPCPSLPHADHGRVIDREKPGESFVDNMRCQRGAQGDPRRAKAAGLSGTHGGCDGSYCARTVIALQIRQTGSRASGKSDEVRSGKGRSSGRPPAAGKTWGFSPWG